MAPIKIESLDFCAISESESNVVPFKLFVYEHLYARVALVFSFRFWCQCIEERYLSINYICTLKYYYNIQVYWELAVFWLIGASAGGEK